MKYKIYFISEIYYIIIIAMLGETPFDLIYLDTKYDLQFKISKNTSKYISVKISASYRSQFKEMDS